MPPSTWPRLKFGQPFGKHDFFLVLICSILHLYSSINDLFEAFFIAKFAFTQNERRLRMRLHQASATAMSPIDGFNAFQWCNLQ